MDMSALKPNEKKSLEIETSGGTYQRYPVKTHVVMAGDSLTEIMDRYVKPYLEQEDMIFISEKIMLLVRGALSILMKLRCRRLQTSCANSSINHPMASAWQPVDDGTCHP